MRPGPNARLTPMSGEPLGTALEELYSHYNHFEHIHPDPLEFVYHYESKVDGS